MLFYCPVLNAAYSKRQTDILMENYLLYGETLEQGAERILQEILPSAPPQNLHFCFMYHFENEITNRLVYNFILDLNNDSILCNKSSKAENFGHSSK